MTDPIYVLQPRDRSADQPRCAEWHYATQLNTYLCISKNIFYQSPEIHRGGTDGMFSKSI